jgi:N-acyl homoserine lactone hydrolase
MLHGWKTPGPMIIYGFCYAQSPPARSAQAQSGLGEGEPRHLVPAPAGLRVTHGPGPGISGRNHLPPGGITNVQAPQAAPAIDVVLDGFGINTSAGLVSMCEVVLIEGPGADGRPARILVDPAHVGRRTFLLDALAARGLTPADIDMVLLTHAHWDHVQNIDLFAHAPVYLHRDERRYCERPHPNDWATPVWTRDILDRVRLHEVEDGAELIPGVGVVHLPGHSAGSIGVAVQSEQGVALITGDALHYASVALDRRPPLVFWDPDQALASIDRVVAMADIIYPGHDRPFRLTSGRQVEYLREFRLTITGTPADRPGLGFYPKTREPWVMPGFEDHVRPA